MDMLTIQEVCELLKLSRNTVYRLINEGRLRAYLISRRLYRVKESDVQKFLDKTAVGD